MQDLKFRTHFNFGQPSVRNVRKLYASFHELQQPLVVVQTYSNKSLESNFSERKDDPFPVRMEDLSFSQERLAVIKGPLVIELAVFADEAMWLHFDEIYGRDAEPELQKFILTAVNNVRGEV